MPELLEKERQIVQSSDQIVISLKNVNKTFSIDENQYHSIMDKAFNLFKPKEPKIINAIQSINLTVKKGDFLGVIGKNGSGKSTLLKIITGAFPPDKGGKVKVNGRIIRLSLGLGFDENLTARENIYVNGSLIGLSLKKIRNKFDEIVHFSGLEEFMNTQVKFFSSGMVSRLAFAIAIHAEVDILLLDEFFGGVGDEDFRLKSNKAFEAFIQKDKTIILVSHNLEELKTYTNKVIWVDKGRIMLEGAPNEVVNQYLKSF